MSLLNLRIEQNVSSKKPTSIQKPAGKRTIRVDIDPTLVGSYEILLSSVLGVVDILMC